MIGSLYLVMMILVILFSFVQGMCLYLRSVLQGDWFFVFGNDDIGCTVLICTGYVCVFMICASW